MSEARTRLLTVVTDQVVASACVYSLVLLVARGASPRTFGGFLIAFGFISLAAAVSRSTFGVVVGMDTPTKAPEVMSLELRRSATVLLVGGAFASGALVVAGAILHGQLSVLLFVLAAATPVLLLQDLLRFAVVADARPSSALAADLVWLTPCLTVVAIDLGRGATASPTVGALVWLAGLAASWAALSWRERLRPAQVAGIWTWLRADRRRLHLAIDASIGAATPLANASGAALAAGPAATAAVRGSAALFAPLATLSSAMMLGAVPEAKRRQPHRARRLLLMLTALLVCTSLAWSAIALLLPTSVGEEILGASWIPARELLPYVCVEYAGLALWSGGTAMLRYAGSTRTALLIRLVYAPAAVVLPVAALVVADDVRAFVASLAFLGVVLGTVGLALGLRHTRPATPI